MTTSAAALISSAFANETWLCANLTYGKNLSDIDKRLTICPEESSTPDMDYMDSLAEEEEAILGMNFVLDIVWTVLYSVMLFVAIAGNAIVMWIVTGI